MCVQFFFFFFDGEFFFSYKLVLEMKYKPVLCSFRGFYSCLLFSELTANSWFVDLALVLVWFFFPLMKR